MSKNELNAHTIEIEKVAEELDTSIKNGLSEAEAKSRLEKYGTNEIQETEKISPWTIFLSQFKDFLVYLLFFAIIISVLVGIYRLFNNQEASEFLDAIVISIILIVNAVLGFYQEYKAEKALESLKDMAPHYAKVIRDGEVKKIDVKNVVPGDLLKLDEGDKVPADARLIKEYSLYADEAILTGESQPVEKDLNLYDEKVILADRLNLVYSNTIITRGNGLAIVVRTGMQTEVGKIAESIQEEKPEKTPFQKEVDQFGKILGILILIICFAVFVVELILILVFPEEGVNQFNKIIEAFEVAISLAVSAVPEGLVVVITIVMSIGMRKMAERNALVKTLNAVETLGRVNVICSDKTGTLTKNEMTVRKVFVGGQEYDVEGIGYTLEGKIMENGKAVQLENNEYLKRYLEVCLYCNNSTVTARRDGTNKTDVIGDPTEISLKILAKKMDLETKAEKLDEIPFNSDRKMMSVVVKINGEVFSLIKGAPDIIMKKAGKAVYNGEVKDIEDVRDDILSKNNEFAENALRVLGIGYKPLKEGYSEDEIEQDFVYLGLAGIIDPARDEVKKSIEEARMAGIRTIMITGDHKITAIAIGKEIGLTDREEAITGVDLEEMTDEELIDKIKDIDIFARVTSEHKLRILKALKREGKVVSMTGDGVNDAPAVKGANVGVSMGIKGTEVTQEASDMILLDDDYSTIVNAIEEGRGIFETTKGFFRYMLSTNFDEIFLILVAYIVIKFFAFTALPILPIQILWLNIATDGIPAMVLGLTPTDPDVMKEEPRKGSSLISEIKGPVLFLGVYTAITDITLYLLLWFVLFPAWAQMGIDPNLTMQFLDPNSPANAYAASLAQTIIFTNLVVCELLFVYSCTSNTKPFWLFPNKHLFWATGLSLGLQLIILYTPLGIAFGVVPLLRLEYWIAILLGGFSVFLVDEIRKWVIRYRRGMTTFTS